MEANESRSSRGTLTPETETASKSATPPRLSPSPPISFLADKCLGRLLSHHNASSSAIQDVSLTLDMFEEFSEAKYADIAKDIHSGVKVARQIRADLDYTHEKLRRIRAKITKAIETGVWTAHEAQARPAPQALKGSMGRDARSVIAPLQSLQAQPGQPPGGSHHSSRP